MNTDHLHFDRVAPSEITRVPRRVIAVVCELGTIVQTCSDKTTTHPTRLSGWSVVDCQRTAGDDWTRDVYSGREGGEHWALMASLLEGRRSCWLILPSVTEWLASTGGYAELTSGRLWVPTLSPPAEAANEDDVTGINGRPGTFILNPQTEIIIGRYCSTECYIVAASNYGIADLRRLLDTFGDKAACKDVKTIGPGRFAGSTHHVADALSSWYCGLIDQWKAGDMGIWAATASKLSHNYYRRRFATKALTLHKNKAAHRLERAALYGGRAEVYQREPQAGRFYRIDASSHYPSILATLPAPVGFTAIGGETPVKRLLSVCQTHCVIARVRLTTATDDFPIRLWAESELNQLAAAEGVAAAGIGRKRRTLYPVGTFVTTLCGPELALAMEREQVEHVYEHAIYRTGGEFIPMFRECIDRRRAAKREGDGHGESLWKLLANSFAGRLAQRTGGWVADRRISNGEAWGRWTMRHPDSKEYVQCRSIGFIAQWLQSESDEPKGFPIGFAWLTACGRMKLRELIRTAGDENVLMTDTDGLWCNEAGYAKLQQRADLWGDDAGKIRLIEEASSVEFITPKHYRTGSRWVMSGFADGFRIEPNGTIVDYARRSLYEADSADGPTCTLIDRRVSSIRELYDNHRCAGPFGRTFPWRMIAGDGSLHPYSVAEPDDD